jgi:NitT/TauT family transport system substrate-binding protein
MPTNFDLGSSTMKTFLRFLLFFFAASSLLFPAAVSEAADPSQKLTKLKVAILPFLSYAPFFIAQEEGLFSAQGLDLEIIRFSHSPEAIPALIQGSIDAAGGLTTVGMLNAIARGARIRFVADKGFSDAEGCVYHGLVARRDLVERGELTHPPQLKGRRIAINEASVEGYWVEKILKQGGLSLQDIGAGDIPDSAMLNAFERGAIDLAAPSEPWITRIVDSGHAVLWRSIQEVIPDFQFGVLLFGPTLLDKNPEAGNRFILAYLKGVELYNQGKTERNLSILSKHTGLDPAILIRACWPSFRAGGAVHVQSILDFQAWGVEKRFVEKAVDATSLYDSRFVEHARVFENTK